MNKREYIQANKDWLMAKSKEEGVNALSKGIYYKVLSEGNPDTLKPTVRSIITAHYTGRTIDGNQFSQPGIPGGSTLIFEIELLGIG
jgi:FKBP-type peptidyl-prolyl cis-trans isomerase